MLRNELRQGPQRFRVWGAKSPGEEGKERREEEGGGGRRRGRRKAGEGSKSRTITQGVRKN